ncbi:alpha/beta fold hydrolase [Pseudaquabacterium rugosum]|uniref:Alpha/beta hydrolase n=1 Tax=Pseudaquabacterium rugosum TaxID=2984194 RepID=A0ABU9BAL9_9BURK
MNPAHLIPRPVPRPGGVTLTAHVADAARPDATPLLLQHGLCGSAQQTAEACPDDPALRLLTLECRGHGRSDAGPLDQLSIATFADDLIAWITALGLPPLVLGGISMGAAIACRVAVLRPELVRALVLVRPAWVAEAAPANMAPNAEVGALLAAHPGDPAAARAAFEAGDTARRLADEAPDNLASLRGFFDRAPLDVTAALLQRISADGPGVSEAQLRALDVPALVVGHGHDAIHPWAHAERLAGLLPQARLQAITPKALDKAAYVAELHAAISGFTRALG